MNNYALLAFEEVQIDFVLLTFREDMGKFRESHRILLFQCLVFVEASFTKQINYKSD